MDLAKATSTITMLKNKTTLDAAFTSYESSHDSKHREASRAYSYNHGSATGNDSAGYYQKVLRDVDPTGPISVTSTAWGKTTTTNYSERRVDLTVADEKALLLKAVSQAGRYISDHDVRVFKFGVDVPAGYAGYLFRDGGKVFPKIADPVTHMIIVIYAGPGNIRLISHYPESAATVQGMPALT